MRRFYYGFSKGKKLVRQFYEQWNVLPRKVEDIGIIQIAIPYGTNSRETLTHILLKHVQN